ncbi:MAG: hypothetical protein ACREFZ_08110, partial [Acetobacteraceae bacterium]
CNAAADAVMAKASSTFDDAVRTKLEREAFAMANHDHAYIPLYYQDEIAGIANDVAWKQRPDGLVLAWQMHRK